jgi:hypothetical protein
MLFWRWRGDGRLLCGGWSSVRGIRGSLLVFRLDVCGKADFSEKYGRWACRLALAMVVFLRSRSDVVVRSSGDGRRCFHCS